MASNYPPKGVYEMFLKGITLILDSFAYFDIQKNLRLSRDYSKVYTKIIFYLNLPTKSFSYRTSWAI